MNDYVDLAVEELDRYAAQLQSLRMSAPDTRLWAIAALTEAAYCLRAVRAAGIVHDSDALLLLTDCAEIVFSEPERPVKVIRAPYGPEQEGKPN